LGGEDVKRFHCSSHSTRMGEFLKKVGKEKKKEEDKSGNISSRWIVEWISTNQTRNFEVKESCSSEVLWNDGYKLRDQKWR